MVTIGAPATASHVAHLFKDKAESIQQQGEALVSIGGREFPIKKQFLDDIEAYASTEKIRNLKAALLVFHSPLDTIVSIDEAAAIYQAARHPKSFISLDRADHLLSKAADAEYVATTIAAWANRYLRADEPAAASSDLADGEVLITELDRKFLRGMYSKDHFMRADEPEKIRRLRSRSVALRPAADVARRLYIDDAAHVRQSQKTGRSKTCKSDCSTSACTPRIASTASINSSASRAGSNWSATSTTNSGQRLLEIADRCPVHRTLESDPQIVSELVKVARIPRGLSAGHADRRVRAEHQGMSLCHCEEEPSRPGYPREKQVEPVIFARQRVVKPTDVERPEPVVGAAASTDLQRSFRNRCRRRSGCACRLGNADQLPSLKLIVDFPVAPPR